MIDCVLESLAGRASGWWSHTFSFVPKEKSELNSLGQIFLFVGVEQQELGQALAGHFINSYGRLSHEPISYNDRLVKALELTREWAKKRLDKDFIFAVLVVFDQHKKIEVGIIGLGQVFIVRSEKLAVILSGSAQQVRTVSGTFRNDDHFLCIAQNIVSHISFSVIKSTLSLHPSRAAPVLQSVLLEAGITENTVGYGAGILGLYESKDFKLKAVKVSLPGFPFNKSVQKPALGLIWRLFDRKTGSTIKLKRERGLFLFRRDVYVNSRPTNKKLLFFGVASLVILVSVIVFGVLQHTQTKKKQVYEKQLQDAIYKLDQAQSLADLNPSRARDLARDSKNEVEALISQGVDDNELLKLQQNLTRSLPKILAEYPINAKLLFDFHLVKDGFTPQSITASSKRLAVLDTKNKLIARFDFDGKNMQVYGGEDISGARLAAVGGSRTFVVDGQRIVELTQDGTKTAVLSDGNWRDPAFLGAYDDNLYIIDRGNTQIWRYPKSQSGNFGGGQEWLGVNTQGQVQQDLEQAMSFTIDGSIWLLNRSGEIIKLTQGKVDSFATSGLEKPLVEPIAISTHVEASNLYVLDRGAKRIVAFDKKGKYVSSYTWDKLDQASGFAVSETAKKIVILVGNSVYAADLDI